MSRQQVYTCHFCPPSAKQTKSFQATDMMRLRSLAMIPRPWDPPVLELKVHGWRWLKMVFHIQHLENRLISDFFPHEFTKMEKKNYFKKWNKIFLEIIKENTFWRGSYRSLGTSWEDVSQKSLFLGGCYQNKAFKDILE